MNLFNKIPSKRIFIYMLIIGCLPVVSVLLEYSNRKSHLDELDNRLTSLSQSRLVDGQRQYFNSFFLQHHQKVDAHYIEKLESLNFLCEEKKQIEKMREHALFKDNEVLKKRLQYLSSKENKFVFVEGSVVAQPHLKETQLSLAHPVEINGEDLKKILSMIESLPNEALGAQEASPHLIITDFRIDRKSDELMGEVYKLDLKLLKRDY